MFKKAIEGLDKIFTGDIPKGSIVIITGTAGSLKSAFVYNLLSHYLKDNKNEKGLYVTLEESRKSHMENMRSLGISIVKRLKISDLASFRAHISFEDMDYLDLIKQRAQGAIGPGVDTKTMTAGKIMNNSESSKSASLTENKKIAKLPISCFALDSLNALYSLIGLEKHKMRNKLLEFFTFLRQNNLTSFIVLEMPQSELYSDEFFLADGVIEFGITKASQDTLKRYIQVKKMRSTKHSLDPFLLEVGKNGLKVVGRLL
ncbi:RAD55 family ATPase [[Eubacterium] cellulosolvens]